MSELPEKGNAMVAKRFDPSTRTPKKVLEEIQGLVEAAGYEVVGKLSQKRHEDSKYMIGSGKVDELHEIVEREEADLVVFDNELRPKQNFNLEDRLDDTKVIDRYRLILSIFSDQAQTREAQLQIELAELKYELPRVKEAISRDTRNVKVRMHNEEGKPIDDMRRRIDEIKNKLEAISNTASKKREERRERGFDIVTIAGYTNAGKSTLFRRLVDGMEVDEDSHEDINRSAEIEDRLFKTLETTTRKAEVKGRRTLLTDTVGFVKNVPMDFIESFRSTLEDAYEADLVLLITDANDSLEEFRKKLETSVQALEGCQGEIVPVINKIDLVGEEELDEKRSVVRDSVGEPVEVSAIEEKNMNELEDKIHNELPDLEKEVIEVENSDEAMSFVSWLYEKTNVKKAEYKNRHIEIEFESSNSVVERARSKAGKLKKHREQNF